MSGELDWATQQREQQLLVEEFETLTLYKALVDHAPDLFSLHCTSSSGAPFRFACDNFKRLQLSRRDLLGQPLASIVDPRDQNKIQQAVLQVTRSAAGSGGGGGGGSRGGDGTLVELRVMCGRVSFHASMTIAFGSEGLIVVTRLYQESV